MSNFSVDRQAILVLGMHRSGTSALTRVINLLGFGLPRALIPPSQYNERGFWETQVLADFHDRVLESAGSYWHDWSKFNSDWHGSPVSSPFREELKRIIDSEFGMNDAFVIKDPRICRFVPLWVDTLQSLQIQPYAVIPIRHPLEVVHSLRERDRFTDQKSLLLWLRHVLDAEGSSRHLPRAFCTYESLLSDWHGTMKRMGTQMGVVWPRLSMDSRIEIGDFLSSKIRHHVFASQDLNAEKGIGEWIRETYHLLDGLYTDPNDAIAQQRLDKIREDFDSGCATFGVAMRREEREAERQRDKALELDATVRERTAEAARLENDLAEARRLIAELDTAVREQAAEAVRLESDLAEAQQCAEDSLAALQERMVEAARLRDDLESARQQSIALTQEIDEIRKSISWRMTAPVRTIGFQFPWLDRQIHQAPEWMERLKSFR